MSENETEQSPIRGAFVLCKRVYGGNIGKKFEMIKLSSINSVQAWEWSDTDVPDSRFYTYKDAQYYADCHPYELTKAINGCLFEPEKHWEKYPS